jgi:hypothetical protein
MTEILCGFGKLEARNLIRCALKIKLITKVGLKEIGKQKHQLYRKSPSLHNSDMRYSDMPAFAHVQIKAPSEDQVNPTGLIKESSQMMKRKHLILKFIDSELSSGSDLLYMYFIIFFSVFKKKG